MASQEARQRTVVRSCTRLPAVLVCSGCALTRPGDGDDPEVLAELHGLAEQHALRAGHRVTVTTAQQLAVEPAGD